MKVKIRVLIRRIRRSFMKDKEQWIKGGILAAILLVIVIVAGSCACGKKKTVKEPDAASQGVMKITPIPSTTPTVAPRQVDADAVTQNDGVTMVNEYLVQKNDQKSTGTADSTTESTADNAGGENQDGNTGE